MAHRLHSLAHALKQIEAFSFDPWWVEIRTDNQLTSKKFVRMEFTTLNITVWIFVSAVVCYTLAAAILDLQTRKIPNWLTVSSLAAALCFHAVVGGLEGLGGSIAGFAVGFGALFVLWLIGGGGGGDVKLMGALGAWLGVKFTLIVFMLSAMFAIMASMAVIGGLVVQNGITYVMRRHARQSAGSGGQAAISSRSATPSDRRSKRRLLPYAAPVALGTWLVLFWQVFKVWG